MQQVLHATNNMKKMQWINRLLREKCGYIPQRYVMTIMSFFGVVICFILRTCLSMAILKISPYHGLCGNRTVNGSMLIHHEKNVCSSIEDLSDYAKGQIVDSFYFGYLIAHLPGAYLARRMGGKYTVGLSVLLSCVCSLVTPFAACYSSAALVVSRVAMGLAQGPLFPALTELLSQWAPPFERTLLTSIIFAGVQIGIVVSLSVTTLMLDQMEWPKVFYIMGGVGCFWFILWCLLCYNKPSQHPFIMSQELDYLKEQIPEAHKEMSTPWLAMLKSKPLWALTIAEIGHDYGFYIMLAELPKYFTDIVGVTFASMNDGCVLPYLIMWLVSVLLGYTSDKILSLKWTTTTQLRRVLATLGAVVPGLGMVLASYITDRGTFIGVIVVSIALMGCCYSSIRVNPLDLSPNHAATIMAITNGLGALSGAINPGLVDLFLNVGGPPCTNILLDQSDKRKAWQNVFWVLFAILVVSIFPFLMFGTGDVQPWDKPKEGPARNDIRRRSTISGGEPIRERYRNYYPEQPMINE